MATLYYLTSACYSFMHYSTAGAGKVRAQGQHCFQAESRQKISVSQIECAGLIADYLSDQRFLNPGLYLVTSSHVQNEALPPPWGSRRTRSVSQSGMSILHPWQSHHNVRPISSGPEPRKPFEMFEKRKKTLAEVWSAKGRSHQRVAEQVRSHPKWFYWL